jgi:hypothetical protein
MKSCINRAVYHLAPVPNRKREKNYYQYFTEQNIRKRERYFVPFSIFAFVKPYKIKVV